MLPQLLLAVLCLQAGWCCFCLALAQSLSPLVLLLMFLQCLSPQAVLQGRWSLPLKPCH